MKDGTNEHKMIEKSCHADGFSYSRGSFFVRALSDKDCRKSPRRISVLPDGLQVPACVIQVLKGLVLRLTVFPDQLVRRIVMELVSYYRIHRQAFLSNSLYDD